jgi:hypothetical protein
MSNLLAQTDRSVAAAVADGTLDAEVSAGPIEALREIARLIDAGNANYVTVPAYQNGCAALRITPATRDKPKEGAGGKLADIRAIRGGRASA